MSMKPDQIGRGVLPRPETSVSKQGPVPTPEQVWESRGTGEPFPARVAANLEFYRSLLRDRDD